MLGNENNRMNNVMNRRNHQYQEINDSNQNITPKSRYYYQNVYNNINKNNFSSNNSLNKQNVKVNMNMNININRNNMNSINNISNKNNNNVIRTTNSFSQNNNINRALMVIKNEFRKKDEKIKALELKVAELENKINMLAKSNNFQTNINNINQNPNPNPNIINLNQKKIGKNFTFADKYSEEINPSYNKRDSNMNKTPEINYKRENNPFRNPENNQNNNNYFTQTKSANQYKIKNSNDNEFMLEQKYSINKNTNSNDGSIFTGNSSNFQRHSKNDVKLYLKEVKSKVDPMVFKEFIQNIKLLTNSKNKIGVDKKSVIEKVRILFGEQFKDLFIKFESILGFNN